MPERDATKRPRRSAADNSLPKIPKSLHLLRHENPKRYVSKIIEFLRSISCHPNGTVGWWCHYPSVMKDLITFLADCESYDITLWKEFRREVATQLSHCRQCATMYHEAVSQWELSDEVSEWSPPTAKRRIKSLVDWDLQRLLPFILKGAGGSSRDNPISTGTRLQCREAFLEALVSLRLCMDSKFCEGLAIVFRHRSPARDEEDVLPFIRSLKAIPPGLLALCFDRSNALRAWAQRIYTQSSKSCKVHKAPLNLVLRRALRQCVVDESSGSQSRAPGVPDLNAVWDGYAKVICSLGEAALEEYVKTYRKGGLLKQLESMLGNHSEFVVEHACDCIHHILEVVPSDSLFDTQGVSPHSVLQAIFRSFGNPVREQQSRRKLLLLLGPLLASVKQNQSKAFVSLYFKKCFDLLREASTSLSLAESVRLDVGPHAAARRTAIRKSKRYVLKTGASLLRTLYRYTAPALPFEDPSYIGNFVLEVLAEFPDSGCGWDLFRDVLLTDVLNMIRVIKNDRDISMIFETFLMKRPTTVTEVDDHDKLRSIVFATRSTGQSMTWVHGLWEALKNGTHVQNASIENGVVSTEEVETLLDIHRLIGAIDARRSGHDLNDSVIFSAQNSQELVSDESKKQFIRRCMGFAQEAVARRLSFACDCSGEHDWWKNLPFHATHLLSSTRQDVALKAFKALQKSYKLGDAMVKGSQAKLLALFMKNDPLSAKAMAEGCVASMQIMSALGGILAIRSYACFFLWYRVLLDSEYIAVLENEGSSKWVLGVTLTFVDNWKSFQATETPPVFKEACCRFLSNLRDVLPSFQESQNVRDNASKNRSLDAYFNRVIRGLLAMYTVEDSVIRSAWVNLVNTLIPKLRDVPEHQKHVLTIIISSAKERDHLDYDQCRILANNMKLKEAEEVLNKWARDLGRTKRHEGSAGSRYREDTKIDQYFSKTVPVPMRDAGLPPRQTYPPSLFKAPISGRQHNSSHGLIVKRQMPALPGAKTNFPSTALQELRRNHRLSVKDARKKMAPAVGVPRRNAEHSHPTKTKYELLRERSKAERVKKNAHRSEQDIDAQRAEMLREAPDRSAPGLTRNMQQSSEMIDNFGDFGEEQTDRFKVPKSKRDFEPRAMALVHRDLIHRCEPSQKLAHLSRSPETFLNVEQYVAYWEPHLICEFRASLKNSMREENVFAERHVTENSFEKCRAPFEVESPVATTGHLQDMSLRSCEKSWKSSSSMPRTGVSCEFDVFGAQASDLVQLHIKPRKASNESSDQTVPIDAIGIVSKAVRQKGDFYLHIKVAFDGFDSAPGKGRQILVSRLTTLTTFHRQLDALWSVRLLPHGILWALLNPRDGLKASSELEDRNSEPIDEATHEPVGFARKMKSNGDLNSSQYEAIVSVVRKSATIFGKCLLRPFSTLSMPDQGSISLIQGPPGTGKTSTVVNLLSGVIASFLNAKSRRKARVILEDGPFFVDMPPVRILVCAPSNAAVDELMLRVMNDGLQTPDGHKMSPHIVRVGSGATNDSIRKLELRALAKCGQDTNPNEGDSKGGNFRIRLRELQLLNEKIGQADKERKQCVQQREESEGGTKINGNDVAVKSGLYKTLTDRLTSLHERKTVLNAIVSEERNLQKRSEAGRKLRDLKSMCTSLNRASICFSTLSSSVHEVMKTVGARFDMVIIDEAGQCTEPDVLMPMTYGCSEHGFKFSHVVLVGDPKQLPATVLSADPVTSKALGKSLFERIGTAVPENIHMLKTQYRMHPDICSFPSHQFYQGLLQNGENVMSKSIHQAFHFDKDRRFGPFTFLDTSSTNTREVRNGLGSLSNPGEARVAITVLLCLLSTCSPDDLKGNIVILTPYREQVALLKRMVSDNRILRTADIEVNTVDGIQGREKSIVIMSTVRSDSSRGIGFVNDDRRMNVALTRAKHSLIVVGHGRALSENSRTWAALVSHCRSQNQLISVPTRSSLLFPEARTQRPARPYLKLPPFSELPEVKENTCYKNVGTAVIASTLKRKRSSASENEWKNNIGLDSSILEKEEQLVVKKKPKLISVRVDRRPTSSCRTDSFERKEIGMTKSSLEDQSALTAASLTKDSNHIMPRTNGGSTSPAGSERNISKSGTSISLLAREVGVKGSSEKGLLPLPLNSPPENNNRSIRYDTNSKKDELHRVKSNIQKSNVRKGHSRMLSKSERMLSAAGSKRALPTDDRSVMDKKGCVQRKLLDGVGRSGFQPAPKSISLKSCASADSAPEAISGEGGAAQGKSVSSRTKQMDGQSPNNPSNMQSVMARRPWQMPPRNEFQGGKASHSLHDGPIQRHINKNSQGKSAVSRNGDAGRVGYGRSRQQSSNGVVLQGVGMARPRRQIPPSETKKEFRGQLNERASRIVQHHRMKNRVTAPDRGIGRTVRPATDLQRRNPAPRYGGDIRPEHKNNRKANQGSHGGFSLAQTQQQLKKTQERVRRARES